MRRCAIKLRSCGRRVAHSTALGMKRNRLAGSRQDPVTAETRAWTLSCRQEQPDPMLIRAANGGSHDREGWRLVTLGSRRAVPSAGADLHLQNRFNALVAGEGLDTRYQS